IVVGRHLWPIGSVGNPRATIQMEPRHVFQIFLLAFIIGFFHIFVSVGFDPLEVVRQFGMPRFSQPWSRAQFGGAYSLLYELGMLIYLLPPLAGLMFARGKDYGWFRIVIAVLILCFTMYYGFSLGTRNILGTYVVTFLAAYFLSLPKL